VGLPFASRSYVASVRQGAWHVPVAELNVSPLTLCRGAKFSTQRGRAKERERGGRNHLMHVLLADRLYPALHDVA